MSTSLDRRNENKGSDSCKDVASTFVTSAAASPPAGRYANYISKSPNPLDFLAHSDYSLPVQKVQFKPKEMVKLEKFKSVDFE